MSVGDAGRTFTEFEPIIVTVTDGDGGRGFGEGHISPGSSSETRDGGWRFINQLAATIVGCSAEEAYDQVVSQAHLSPVAATALVTAIEMLSETAPLVHHDATYLPLLSPVSGQTNAELEVELEYKLSEGYRTFKVKVGKDVDQDLARLERIQSVVGIYA